MNKLSLIAIFAIIGTIGVGYAIAESYIIITQSAGQSTNPLCIQDSAGTDLTCFDTSGNLDLNTNNLKGSTGCSNGEILEYNSATDTWDCGADAGGTTTLESLTNVTSTGCASGEVLTVSGTSWICATNSVVDIGSKVDLTVSQDIVTSTTTLINFTSEVWDTDTMHSTVTDNERVVINTAGKYLIVVNGNYQSLTDTTRVIWLLDLDGTTFQQLDRQAQSESDDTMSAILDLSEGQYITLSVWHDEGINRTFNGNLALQRLA